MRYPKTLIIKLILYSVLIICSFILLIYSSRVYEESVSKNETDEKMVISLSYLKTKVMMTDNVDIVTYDDVEMLLIDEENFDNYIFYDDGVLYEITVVNDYRFRLDEADKIIEIDNLIMTKDDDFFVFEVEMNRETERLLVKR